MNQYQLIALDMDGTLLNSKKQLSEGNRAALERAVRFGLAALEHGEEPMA